MKQKILLILVAVFATATTAWAYDDDCGDGVKWSLNDGTLTISYSGSGTGAMTNYNESDSYNGNQPWEENKYDIKTIVIEDGVTSIGYFAFYGCKNVESVTIANSVKWIYGHAFAGCSSLTSVTMPGDFYFSEGVEDNYVNDLIDDTSFDGCNNLTTLTLTGTGTDADPYVVDYDNPLQSGSSELAGIKNLIIGDGITDIDDGYGYVFAGYTGLTSVTIGSSVKTICQYAFNGCTGLTSITIPDNVETIGMGAFYECNGLKSVVIGSGVETIGYDVFGLCIKLTSVTIGSGVTTIGQYAFQGCTSLASIFIPNNVETIADHAFWNCTGLTTVIIGSGVTSIGEDAFSGCKKVTDVYCYANPKQLTWIDSEEGKVCDDFITNPKDPNYPTRCHVKEADLATFKSKWSQGDEDTDINVEFVSSTFNIDITIGNPTSGAPRTSILGNGTDEQTYTNTPTVWGIGALKAPDSNTVTIGSDVKLPFTKTLSELMGDKATGNLKNAAVTSGTNVAVGDFDGWNTEITVLGTGTSVVTLVMQDESTLPITFTVAETIFVLSEAVGITTGTTGNVENIKGKVAQFSRVFTPGVVSTLCLPFSMTSDLEGTLYEFKDVTYNAEAGAWVADFTQDVEPTEETPTVAGKPYLFRAYATVTNDMPLLFSGKVANRFSGLAGTSEAAHAGGGTWTFHGTYNELSYSETLTGDVYGFAGATSAEEGVSAGDFVKAVTGAKVPAFRCYLTYSDGNGGTSLSRDDTDAPNSLPSRIIVRLIGLDGQTTAIGTMDTRTGEVRLSDEWYSLDGRKLEGQPTKEGIYINKGKKLRIKN